MVLQFCDSVNGVSDNNSGGSRTNSERAIYNHSRRYAVCLRRNAAVISNSENLRGRYIYTYLGIPDKHLAQLKILNGERFVTKGIYASRFQR